MDNLSSPRTNGNNSNYKKQYHDSFHYFRCLQAETQNTYPDAATDAATTAPYSGEDWSYTTTSCSSPSSPRFRLNLKVFSKPPIFLNS